ncbi:hypothetical protein [Granulicella arctica]|uniref:hypothetical protein n=1 Tax=Granulicella arctica TaxID=940613 RepID=UPI0021DFFCDF|nr:hypothetical protein [Granulicella arctica]
MTWFGAAVRVERFDDADGLRFRVTSERRLAALILPMLVGVMLFAFAWEEDVGGLLLLGAAGLIGLPVWRWMHVRVTELRVTAMELVVEGDGGRAKGMIWLPWSEVSGLQFQRGSAEPDGLYALKGFADRECLVPDVSDGQAGEIVRAIYARFPLVAMAEAVETSAP